MQIKAYLTLEINTDKVEENDEWDYAQEKLNDWLDTANQFGIVFEDVEIK